MKRYGSDYRRGEEGYQYTKEWYKSLLDRDELQKQAVLWMGISAALTVLFIVGLSLNNSGSRQFWVLMPYVFMVFPLAYGWRGCVSLYLFCRKMSGKNPLRTDGTGKNPTKVIVPKEHRGHLVRSEYEQGIRRSVRSAWALAILAGACFGADVGFIALQADEIRLGREILFAADTLGMAVLGILLIVQTKRVNKKIVKIK